MCGGCGSHATDPISAVLRGSYARLVVAKFCSDLCDAVRVRGGATGWMVTCRSRHPIAAGSVGELARAVAGGVAASAATPPEFADLVTATVGRQPPHRAIPVPEFWAIGAPTRWIYELTAHALLHAASPGGAPPDGAPPRGRTRG